MNRKAIFWVVMLCGGSIALALVVLIWRDPAHWSAMQRFATSDRPITFFGKVVDQDGKPLPGASVSISIQKFKITSVGSRTGNHFVKHVLQRRTDESGAFRVEGESGSKLFIEKIMCSGYVDIPEPDWTYEPYYSQLSFSYSPAPGTLVYLPDPNRPALFPLRREGEARVAGPSKGGTTQMSR